jgi:hypothetical protein
MVDRIAVFMRSLSLVMLILLYYFKKKKDNEVSSFAASIAAGLSSR